MFQALTESLCGPRYKATLSRSGNPAFVSFAFTGAFGFLAGYADGLEAAQAIRPRFQMLRPKFQMLRPPFQIPFFLHCALQGCRNLGMSRMRISFRVFSLALPMAIH